MTQIGSFQRTAEGFQGKIWTLGLFIELALVPAEPMEGENAPHWRVHLGGDADGPEVGAGWNRVGEKAGAYVAVQLDSPALPQPIRANLFQSGAADGEHALVWTRAARRDERN